MLDASRLAEAAAAAAAAVAAVAARRPPPRPRQQAEERQLLWASARQGMADEWDAERQALLGEAAKLRAALAEAEPRKRKEGEMREALKARGAEIERLTAEVKKLGGDVREEGMKRAAAESKRRGAEQMVTTLKQQVRDAEAEAELTRERMARLRGTVEQLGRQLRDAKAKEKREAVLAENAPPANGSTPPPAAAPSAQRAASAKGGLRAAGGAAGAGLAKREAARQGEGDAATCVQA